VGLAVVGLGVLGLEPSVVWLGWGEEDVVGFEQPQVSGKKKSPRVRGIRVCGWPWGRALGMDFMEKRCEIVWEENEVV